MKHKTYLSRSQSKFWSAELPVGDAFGGPAYGEKNDPTSILTSVGGSIISGLIGGNASQSAANTQASAQTNAANDQMAMYNQTRADQAPWRQAGATALGQLTGLTGSNTSDPTNLLHQFNASDLNSNLAPNYAFQLGQGQNATNNAASVTGGLVGGNALKGLQDYTQGAAGSAYQQAYTNYNNNQANIFNRLSNIAGLGQQAGANATTGGSSYGNSIGNNIAGAGASQAAGTVGSANALTGGINNASSMYALGNFLNNNNNNNNTTPPTPTNMNGFYTPSPSPWATTTPQLGSGAATLNY